MRKFIIIILSMVCYQLSAQQINKESIDSGGGFVASAEFSIIHTIGELVVAEKAEGNIHVSEGFINGQLMKITDIESFSMIEDLTIYPNPTSDIINVNFSERGSYKILLTGNRGALLKEYYSENILDKSIDLSYLASGVYYLTIINTNKKLFQSYQVIRQ